jgi:hypothetical protein
MISFRRARRALRPWLLPTMLSALAVVAALFITILFTGILPKLLD